MVMVFLQMIASHMQSVCADDLESNLKAHVVALARDIGERNVWHPEALHHAADYVREVWTRQGYEVAAHEYQVEGRTWANLEVTRPGRRRAPEIILIGAHYDSVIGSPGANDNATGVAALLEIARYFGTQDPERTVRFVAFVNEEPPFFLTRNMGSQVYARSARKRGDDIRAMLSLETIGYYRDEPKSQRYPPIFGLFYPDQGNFVAFISNLRSRPLLKEAVAAFRSASDFPIESAATFMLVPGVGWSDHLAFWVRGYRALMVTDTAPYRYPYYHTAEDTPEKINYPALARVTDGLCAVAAALANPR